MIRQRTFWTNGAGKSVAGVAGATFEKRKGGSDFAREALETKTADGGLSGDVMPDYLHLSEAGYQIWADAITPTLNMMLGKAGK